MTIKNTSGEIRIFHHPADTVDKSLWNRQPKRAMAQKMIPYTGNPLDRKSDKRQDPAWVAALHQHPDSLFLPACDGALLFAPDDSGQGLKPAFLSAGQAPGLDGQFVFLGLDGERGLFAYDMPSHSHGPGEFLDLRRAAPLLSQPDLAIAAEAKALTEWHRRNRFCGVCGARTETGMGGHMRHCPHCGADIFPRIDPAVIVLVTHGDACLLGRNAKWEEGRFSTLAGFVEAGEGIEETVRREIFEEAGITVTGMQYFASQPWPYPAALMLGFFAECEKTEIRTDPAEIAEAYWFTRDEARALLDGTHPTRHGPMTTAIAHKLIRHWAGP